MKQRQCGISRKPSPAYTVPHFESGTSGRPVELIFFLFFFRPAAFAVSKRLLASAAAVIMARGPNMPCIEATVAHDLERPLYEGTSCHNSKPSKYQRGGGLS